VPVVQAERSKSACEADDNEAFRAEASSDMASQGYAGRDRMEVLIVQCFYNSLQCEADPGTQRRKGEYYGAMGL
jgi:hypothetical protein